MSKQPKVEKVVPVDEIKLVFVPCENAEERLTDGLKFLLEIAMRQKQEAA